MKFNYRKLLAEVESRDKFSITDSDSQFVAYKDLADLDLIKLEVIGNRGYVVSKNGN